MKSINDTLSILLFNNPPPLEENEVVVVCGEDDTWGVVSKKKFTEYEEKHGWEEWKEVKERGEYHLYKCGTSYVMSREVGR